MSSTGNTLNHDLVVIGASAGGIEALSELAAQLLADLPAAVLVVQHTATDAPGVLAEILNARGPLPAAFAEHGEALHRGRIYIAPPDHHLLVREQRALVVRGPRENRARPAIDPLFRSAAVAYGGRVVGVILTGQLNDGAAGLLAVKRCGGLAVVQDPRDAAAPAMPEAALASVDVDCCVALSEMGALLGRLTRVPAPAAAPIPEDVLLEARLTEQNMDPRAPQEEPAQLDQLGDLTPTNCPECGGPLWELSNGTPRRYRCHVGHAFSSQALIAEQAEAIEKALWVALRTLSERARMLDDLARHERRQERLRTAADYEARAAEAHAHADQLRQLLLDAARQG